MQENSPVNTGKILNYGFNFSIRYMMIQTLFPFVSILVNFIFKGFAHFN